VLFQGGQLLSSAGTSAASIAFPLLVLATTGSASKAGFVAFTRTLAFALCTLPAGLWADHGNRKQIMVLADAVRAVTSCGIAFAVLAGHAEYGVIVAAAFVEGFGAALFAACQWGAMRAVVPVEQLPDATNVLTGRQAVVQIGGPPIGGALFSTMRSLPFFVDAASYLASTATVLAMRTPFQEDREAESGSLRERLVEGIAFAWRQPFLRTTTLIFGLDNMLIPGITFALVVLGSRRGLGGAEVGLLIASFGAALLVGSVVSPYARRVLPARAALPLELWTWVGFGAYLIWPSVYVLAGCLAVMGCAMPTTDSVVHGYRIAMTPDRLIGRAESARTTVVVALMPFGPLAVGLLLEHFSGRLVVACLASVGVALAVWATLDRSMRDLPPLASLAGPAPP
jgi:predicted MFS family arabinose efflux permease